MKLRRETKPRREFKPPQTAAAGLWMRPIEDVEVKRSVQKKKKNGKNDTPGRRRRLLVVEGMDE